MKISEILTPRPIRTPNLIIFRVPDDAGNVIDSRDFVEVAIVDGKLVTEGRRFTVDNPLDSYHNLEYDHIVLAEKIPGGSISLRTFQIADGEERAFVCAMGDALPPIVEELIKTYEDSERSRNA